MRTFGVVEGLRPPFSLNFMKQTIDSLVLFQDRFMVGTRCSIQRIRVYSPIPLHLRLRVRSPVSLACQKRSPVPHGAVRVRNLRVYWINLICGRPLMLFM